MSRGLGEKTRDEANVKSGLSDVTDMRMKTMMPHQPNHACCRECSTDSNPLPVRRSVQPSSQITSVNESSVPPMPVTIVSEQPEPTSPPKQPTKSLGTFEIKFLIDEDVANDLMTWSSSHFERDPHSDPELGNGYRVNSLYLDTALFDVFHRSEGYRQQKFRLRRYGNEPTVWFEQKRKRHGLVRKKRVGVNDVDITRRLVQAPDADWDGHWYRHRVEERLLKPVCQITYERVAFVKSISGIAARLTIDSKLVAVPATDWTVPQAPLQGESLLNGKRILELKFRGAMPVLFRELVEHYRLQVTSFSKYRTAVERCHALNKGLPHDRRGSSDA